MEIKISEELYFRLSQHVSGFETPEDVITRILDSYEFKTSGEKPDLVFIPDEETFKQNLLIKQQAWKVLEFKDGHISVEEWSAKQFGESSNLRSNIWSGTLRGWENKGIIKLTLTTEKPQDILEGNNMNDANEIRVGQFVRSHCERIIDLCISDDNQLKWLMDKKWSKDKFGIIFPLLMSTDQILKEGIDERYWKKEHYINDKKYRFCSQIGGNSLKGTKTLSEYSGEKFVAYLKENKLLLPAFQGKKIKFIVKS